MPQATVNSGLTDEVTLIPSMLHALSTRETLHGQQQVSVTTSRTRFDMTGGMVADGCVHPKWPAIVLK